MSMKRVRSIKPKNVFFFNFFIIDISGIGAEPSTSPSPGASTAAAGPPLNWEAATTSVDIEDNSDALLCEVGFSFAVDQGIVLKDIKENGCTGEL